MAALLKSKDSLHDDISISQKRSMYKMETNLVPHSICFDWKVEPIILFSSERSSLSYTFFSTCRTEWRMELSYSNIVMREVYLRVCRIDKFKKGLFVHIHLNMRCELVKEFKEEIIKDFYFESGSELGLSFQIPAYSPLSMGCCLPVRGRPCTPKCPQEGQIYPAFDPDFFIKAIIEVKDCCPLTNIIPVRGITKGHSSPENIEKDVMLFPFYENDPTRSSGFEHACQIDWKITNFPRYKDNIISPVFAPVEDCRSRWRMAITFLSGDVEQMRVSIQRVDNEEIEGFPDFYLSVKNGRGDIYYEERVESWPSKEWEVLFSRPSHAQPLLKPGSKTDLFQLEVDEALFVTVAIILKRCCGSIPDATASHT